MTVALDNLDIKLRARRRDLAQRQLDRGELPQNTLGEFVIARRGDVRLGFPIEAMREVRHAPCVPLPKLTDTIRALFHVRGQIHCLIDLWAALHETSPPALPSMALIVILHQRQHTLGVLIDEILSVDAVQRAHINPTSSSQHLPFISDTTTGAVQLIHPSSLFSWPRILMDLAP